MADDKTTKTPEQPVTDSGPGKETPPAPPKEPEKVSVSPEPEKKTEPEVKNPQVSVYNFAEIMKEKKAEEQAAAPGVEKPDPAKAEKPEKQPDMYPLYWTPSRGGIIMRYTYEYKRKCVELYREGKWPETPEGVSDKSFRDKVRLWVRAEDSRGPEALKHKNFNRNWTPEERLELVSQVMSGKSCVSVAIEAGIQDRLLYQWVQNYKTKGYNGLVEMKKGRPSKGVPQMKKEEARPLNESEREELIRLRAENEYIKAENEVIKKEIALREERHAAQLKARKQRSSKSCVKKDTN